MSWRRAQLRLSPSLAAFLEERLILDGWDRVASERRPGEQVLTLSVYAELEAALPGAA